MEELNLVKAWVMDYPGWQGDLLTDLTQVHPGSCGLFPLGRELQHRKEDVLGNVRCRYRQKFCLRRRAVKGEQAAAWIMDFTAWATSQTPPPLGENMRVQAQNGKLYATAPDGTAIYQVELIMEYEKENAYGKD